MPEFLGHSGIGWPDGSFHLYENGFVISFNELKVEINWYQLNIEHDATALGHSIFVTDYNLWLIQQEFRYSTWCHTFQMTLIGSIISMLIWHSGVRIHSFPLKRLQLIWKSSSTCSHFLVRIINNNWRAEFWWRNWVDYYCYYCVSQPSAFSNFRWCKFTSNV